MEGIEVLYDHYKDTFEQQKRYLAKRDHLTVLLMILAILLIGLIFDPNYISIKLNTIINAQVNNLVFDFEFINTGLIIAFFWFSLQYYMIVLQIEKMYKYLDQCETSLCAGYTEFKINREGAYYLRSYPWMKTLADKFFVLGIPIGFIALSVCKIINEWSWISNLHYIDIIFLFLTSLYSLLYISNRMFHEEYFDVEAHPNLHFCTRLKRYFTN
jgi:hypothetical protein